MTARQRIEEDITKKASNRKELIEIIEEGIYAMEGDIPEHKTLWLSNATKVITRYKQLNLKL